jgi:hypothetical protein
MRLPANWNATGGGPNGHGQSLGGGNFQYDGINQNNVENAVNAIPGKGVATVVATTPQTGTYNQPAGGANAVGATFTYGATGATVIDSYTLAAFDTVLLVAQAAAAQNGLYQVSTPGSTGVATILTRVPAMNSAADFPGALIVVGGAGASYLATKWICTVTGSPVLGTTALPFRQPVVKKRVTAQINPASLTLNTDTFDVYKVTGLAAALPITAAGGNPTDRDQFTLCITDTGISEQLSWDTTKFTSFGVVGGLPGFTPAGKKMTMQFVYDADYLMWALAAIDTVGY